METKRQILTDIMGTAVHNDFVKDLVVYFANNGINYLARATPEALTTVDAIAKEQGFKERAEVIPFIVGQIQSRNLRPDYMCFEGLVNAEGFASENLRAPVFEDVPRAFQRWKQNGNGIYVYSQGSADEQVAIFRTSTQGDLTKHIDGYFGTDKFGKKDQADSYKRIADSIKTSPRDIRFLSDRLEELDAADIAGYESVLVERPGNKPVPENKYRMVTTFDTLL